MSGAKISLLINAMKFICSALRKNDRLSIVVFNSVGTRLNPLIKMNEAGKKKVEGIISGITANGGTNIEYGLKIAQSIILQRKYKTFDFFFFFSFFFSKKKKKKKKIQ